tara:strand:- start:7076 stop:7300 length:225 start_codon:yes stop_codon:yes gene_type:complete
MTKIKTTKEPSVNEMTEQLNKVTAQYEESVKQANYYSEIAKRCLGAIEVLQNLLGVEEEKVEEAKETKEEESDA